jgi:hypothetical protein
MSWVHIHLMTNHVPVIGAVIGLLLLAVAVFWRSEDLKKFSLYYFVGLALVTLLVFFTGEPAEEAIEHTAGISEALIERHEEASHFGLIAIELVALVSLTALLWPKLKLIQRDWFSRTMLALVMLAVATMAWVANLGGQIRHTEISSSQEAGQAAQVQDQEDMRH